VGSGTAEDSDGELWHKPMQKAALTRAREAEIRDEDEDEEVENFEERTYA